MLKKIIAGLTAVVLLSSAARAQAPALELKQVKLGVGGAPTLYYLPLALTERLGYFKEQGLDVEIIDFAGGAKALQALIGGSVDVVTGAYEHNIRMQAKGQDIRAVIELGRYPGIGLMLRKDKAASFKGFADLKGMKIGVTAPGSSTQMVAQFLMVKAGLAPDDASFIGVGAGQTAIVAMKKGEIDAVSNIEPVMSKLEQDGDAVTIAETRTTEGTTKAFGGPMPAAVLYLKAEFADKNPKTTQALVNAFYKTLKWLETATPEQIADKVPPEFLLNDRPLYLIAVKASLETYSRTGVITAEAHTRSVEFLQKFDAELKSVRIDQDKTWDPRFIAKAPDLVK